MANVAGEDVYLLGAGFSKAVSGAMPVLAELGPEVVEQLGLPEKTLAPFQDNVEAWLSYLATEQPWLTQAQNLRNRALFVETSDALQEAISERERQATAEPFPPTMARLACGLSDRQSEVLTFNYDLLLERSAVQIGRAHAFSDLYVAPVVERQDPGTGIMISRSRAELPHFRLHKLHGSTNWYYSGPQQGAKGDVYVVRDWMTWPELARGHEDDNANRYSDLVPLIIPPTASKSLFYQNEALRSQWRHAAAALRSATRLVVIGYSFPTSDVQTRALIATNLPASAEVVVVDRRVGAVDTVKTLLPQNPITESYIGGEALKEYVGDACPHLIEWGSSQDSEGRVTARIARDGVWLSDSDLPSQRDLADGASAAAIQSFVELRWPGATQQPVYPPSASTLQLGFSTS
ncbi:MAG TPA: hypothetical protein VFJ97_06685 [Dermatophilaceae bacterium]|nr:hypothetical protein [Dermatophilaceae bacterium]